MKTMKILPTLKQLRHLVALADNRHFGKAAKACLVTQSTLSASVKELEDILQAPLVDRTNRRVAFTPLGEATAERARRLLEGAQEIVLAAQGERAPLTGTVRLGVIPTIGPFLLPRLLPALREAWPKLKLYLREDQTDPLLEQLHAGRLDALVLALPYDCGNVETALLFKDRFSLVLRRDHPLARAKRIDPATVESETLLLLQEGHCLRGHALSACRIGDKAHADAFEATSLPTLVQMVDNGLGVTLLPALALEAGVLKGTNMVARPIDVDNPERDIALVWRKGTARKGEFRLLAQELKRLARQTSG
jgi:LysR family transcriptional regulator, hydrogen peroxide-inducible genes activator